MADQGVLQVFKRPFLVYANEVVGTSKDFDSLSNKTVVESSVITYTSSVPAAITGTGDKRLVAARENAVNRVPIFLVIFLFIGCYLLVNL